MLAQSIMVRSNLGGDGFRRAKEGVTTSFLLCTVYAPRVVKKSYGSVANGDLLGARSVHGFFLLTRYAWQ